METLKFLWFGNNLRLTEVQHLSELSNIEFDFSISNFSTSVSLGQTFYALYPWGMFYVWQNSRI